MVSLIKHLHPLTLAILYVPSNMPLSTFFCFISPTNKFESTSIVSLNTPSLVILQAIVDNLPLAPYPGALTMLTVNPSLGTSLLPKYVVSSNFHILATLSPH